VVHLKRIATLCNIDHNLTSYVSRHSFATQAMLQNVPLLAISAMLGHSKLNTTQIYLKSLPNNILDTYNEQIATFQSLKRKQIKPNKTNVFKQVDLEAGKK